MRKVSTLLVFFVAAVIAGGPAFAGPDRNTEWSGFVSDQKEEFIKVVDTSGEWAELWQRAFKKPAPEVDFEKTVVACIFLGHYARWLYGITIAIPVIRDDQMVVHYAMHDMDLSLTGPFKASGQYRMKVFERPKNVSAMIVKEAGSTSQIRKRKYIGKERP